MNQPSFVHVPQAAFSSFAAVLSAFPWTTVNVTDDELAANDLVNAPLLVVVKLRLQQSVQALCHVASGLRGHDSVHHQQLCAALDAAARSPDPAKRDAAKRMQEMLLSDEGQTDSRDSAEIDFARIQQSLVEHGRAEADVVLLGIEPLLSEIAANSEPFVNDSSAKQNASAMAACVATFAWAADSLEWFLAQVGPGREKELARALLASLVQLSAHHALTSHANAVRDVMH